MMPKTPEELLAYLDELGIETTTVCHEPVFTVAEAKRARAALKAEGTHIKNLFLRNKKKRHWLVVVVEDRRVDLKALGKLLDAGHLSFASPERLMRYLGLQPGAVTPFGVINDEAAEVVVVLDERVAQAAVVHCHPLVNDRTTAIGVAELHTFLEATGHPPQVVNLDP